MQESCTVDAFSACHQNHSFGLNLVRWSKSQMAQETSLYAKEWVRRDEDLGAFPEWAGHSQGQSALESTGNLQAAGRVASYAQTQVRVLIFHICMVFSKKYLPPSSLNLQLLLLLFPAPETPLLLHSSRSWTRISRLATAGTCGPLSSSLSIQPGSFTVSTVSPPGLEHCSLGVHHECPHED